MLISLAMIVKNEEAMLAHCLESVRALVDEMIIVDTGSTDKTIDIANSFGAQVHHFEWRDDFSAARNESLKFCRGDWVLILDADEAIDALDYEKIKNACLYPQADAYNLIHRHYLITPATISLDAPATANASNYSEGKGLPFYADNPCLRLSKMFDGLAFQHKIHETIGVSIESSGRKIENLDAVVHHYGKLDDEREEYKSQYYFMLAKKEADANPGYIPAQFNLLAQALMAKQWWLALSAAMASLKLTSDVDPLVFYGAGAALQSLGRHRESIDYFDMLLRQHPKHALGMSGKGDSCWALGNISDARELMTKAIELQPGSATFHKRLAELEYDAKNLDASRKAALDAIALAPNEPSLYDLLLKIEMTRDNHQQAAQDALLGIRRCPMGGEGRWHRLAAVYLCQENQPGTARSIVELGLKCFPGEPGLVRLKGMI